MFSFGYRDKTWRIIVDICLILAGALLLWRGRFFGGILGIILLLWNGYDLYLLYKMNKARKEQAHTAEPPQTSAQDGKITVTDLSDAKEVNYEKE